MSNPEETTRSLAVVIITRNEAARIATCIRSVLAGVATNFADADVVVIDSNSQDDTTAIAACYPIRVFRYRAPRMSAAAGRWIGLKQVEARRVLFIDGDCELVPGWLEVAAEKLDADPSVGVICGMRRNAHLYDGGVEYTDGGNDLGGTALYRYDALVRCGGFNPFIIGSEEQELCVRLEALGFEAVHTTEAMSIHHTAKKESVAGMWRRHRSGMQSGPGQVLRVALREGLFMRHAKRFDRYILTFVYLAVGLFSLPFAFSGHPAALEDWLALGIVGFGLLAWRRRSIRDATFILADWLSVAIGSFRTFVRTPVPPESFVYTLEAVGPQDHLQEHAHAPASGSPQATAARAVP